MPPDRTPVPRQEPVSCQLCRQRKLKCSRHYPCSNCHARNVKCIYKTSEGSILPSSGSPQIGIADLVAENAEIRARLAKIEKALGGRIDQSSHAPSPVDHDLHHNGRLSRSPAATRNGHSNSFVPVVRIVELDDLVRSFNDDAGVPLPRLEASLKLFEQFVTFLYPMQPFVHCPTVRRKLEAIYENAAQGFDQKTEDVALILVIFSSVAFYCHVEVGPHSCFPSNKFALSLAAKWADYAVNLVWPPMGPQSEKIEIVQAVIQYYFLVHHMHGLTLNVRGMHAATVVLARSMGLHKIDLQEQVDNDRDVLIHREISRRVWWHLSATDWQLAALPGQTEGTYMIHPKQMKVNLPRNVTDDDLLHADQTFTRPLTEPTPLAYYFQRMQIGIICRNIVDTTFIGPHAPAPWEQDYSSVLSIDKMYQDLLDGLPSFMSIDDDGQPVTTSMDTAHPYLKLIRQVLNMMLYMRRFKLHLPYIGLAEQDAQYAPSGEMCLHSAKQILQMHEARKHTMIGDPANGMRINSIMRHLIRGMVIMVMDLDGSNHKSYGKRPDGAIRDAEEVMGGIGEHDKSAIGFLDSLKSMLDEYDHKMTPKSSHSLNTNDHGVNGQVQGIDMNNAAWTEPLLGLNLENFDFDVSWDQYLS